MDADALRDVVRDLLLELDDRTHARVVTDLVERAARGSEAWSPKAPSDREVREIVEFIEDAKRRGNADPVDIDAYLQRGTNAFLAGDYAAARTIFLTVLQPIVDAEIDLGQHEMIEDVLGSDLTACAAQYVVSGYMLAPSEQRAEVVFGMIDEAADLGGFTRPLERLEKIAVEPLPGWEAFLPAWRAVLEKRSSADSCPRRSRLKSKWLQEVVRRTGGTNGLADLARGSRSADDLRAWCQSLEDTGDWKAALEANAEAAELVNDKSGEYRASFLDRAALAAEQLQRKDFAARLEAAWQAGPTPIRLARWLATSGSKAVVRKRATKALEQCPKRQPRQLAFLHVLLGNLEDAASLLTKAPGLGWSYANHPGHFLFAAFERLLARDPANLVPVLHRRRRAAVVTILDPSEIPGRFDKEPHLPTPDIEKLLALATSSDAIDANVRDSMLRAMKHAATKRLAALVKNKRRAHYGHAAYLAAVCAALDESATTEWIRKLRSEYSRHSSLQRAFDEYGLPKQR